jgi:hypothetical protein
MDHNQILQNRADLTDQSATATDCQCCDNHLVFALKDQHHEFSMGLTTILQCLRFAEDQGAIPDLPEDWWIAVRGRYDLSHKR